MINFGSTTSTTNTPNVFISTSTMTTSMTNNTNIDATSLTDTQVSTLFTTQDDDSGSGKSGGLNQTLVDITNQLWFLIAASVLACIILLLLSLIIYKRYEARVARKQVKITLAPASATLKLASVVSNSDIPQSVASDDDDHYHNDTETPNDNNTYDHNADNNDDDDDVEALYTPQQQTQEQREGRGLTTAPVLPSKTENVAIDTPGGGGGGIGMQVAAKNGTAITPQGASAHQSMNLNVNQELFARNRGDSEELYSDVDEGVNKFSTTQLTTPNGLDEQGSNNETQIVNKKNDDKNSLVQDHARDNDKFMDVTITQTIKEKTKGETPV